MILLQGFGVLNVLDLIFIGEFSILMNILSMFSLTLCYLHGFPLSSSKSKFWVTFGILSPSCSLFFNFFHAN